jgi:predicted DNA-binding transcriptional regulator AlpA
MKKKSATLVSHRQPTNPMTTEERIELIYEDIRLMSEQLAAIADSKALNDWISQKQAEQITGLSKSTLYAMRKQDLLTHSTFTGKEVYYRRSDLIRYLDKQEKLRS